MKYIILFILLYSSAFSQSSVYDGLKNGYQMAMELELNDSYFINKNPDWFTLGLFDPHVEMGTVRYSQNTDTLYLTLVYADGEYAYNPNYGRFTRDGLDWVGWHYDASNIGFRYKFLYNNIVSVTLSYFQGSVENNSIRLEWMTLTENDNYAFYVQKKTHTDSTWKNIDTVYGHGTTNVSHTYTSIDNNVTGINDYRLEIISGTGLKHYSDIWTNTLLSVEDNAPLTIALNQNYPNPFNSQTTIQFTIPQSKHVSISIYDILGKEVCIIVNDKLDAGIYKYIWNAIKESSGTYFCKMQYDNTVSIIRMKLIK